MSKTPSSTAPDTPAPEIGFRALAEQLRNQMDAGDWKEGTTFPSLRVLAREYGVGYRTIYMAVQALRQEGRLVSNQNRRLVVRDVFRASASLELPVLLTLSQNRISELVDSYEIRALLMGAFKGAGEIDTSIQIVHDDHLQKSFPVGMANHAFRGIFMLGKYQRALLQQYAHLKIPCVLVDWPISNPGIHHACVANQEAARDAVQRLFSLGHRRIAFVRRISAAMRDVDLDSKERQCGFEQAFQEAGLKCRRQLFFNMLSTDSHTEQAFRRHLKKKSFSAAVAVDATGARMLLDAARDVGSSVPQDLSIVTFQGLEKPKEPTVSGPRIDFEKLGRDGFWLLDKPRQPVLQLRLPTTWVDGDSVAKAPAPSR